MTTPPEPKATEPSAADLYAIGQEAHKARGWGAHSQSYEAVYERALYNAGRASRDAEVEALKVELTTATEQLEVSRADADTQRVLAQQYERDWYAAKSEFGDAMATARGALLAAEAERDKLHAALAWREKNIASVHCYDGATAPYWALQRDRELWETEPHDGTQAGRAAALVRLFERCTDGK